MRKLSQLALFLLAGAAFASGITLITGVRFEFTDCSSSGSAAQTVKSGGYLLRVTDSDLFLCYAATCASGGEKLPQGTVMLLQVRDDTSMSCRSAASSGDLILTRGQ